MTDRPTVAELRTVDLFDELDDAALGEWAAAATVRDVQPGTVFAEQEEPVAGVHLMLSGTAVATMSDGDRIEPVSHQRAPTWMGAISALTGAPLGVRMTTESPSRLALVRTEDFRRLAFAHPAVHQRVMQQVAPVVGRLASIEQHRERLASLGTMAAGLAHELNNPAAAARRAAGELADAIDVVTASLGNFVERGLEREGAARIVGLQRELADAAAGRSALGALDAADAADELLERLEDLGVAEAWTLADTLSGAGADAAWLGRVADAAGPALDAALRWIAATLTARGLADDVRESTERISGLVGAVKSYAYLDRGEVVEIDLHEGLETTLVVLGHRLRHASVEVVRDYDRDLPLIMARGSELNQVWTNLLDNAIDAVGEGGTITVTTRREADCAKVVVADDGPGIAPEVQDRIFDAFVTTKDVGKGTGLGLSTAWRIVVDRHDGSLSVDSHPGRTAFSVWLPLTSS